MAAVAGCHDQVRVDAPEWPDQQAYLLAIDEVGQPVRVWGVDVGKTPVGPDLSLFAATELTAVHFPCSLSTLGLGAGEQRLRAIPDGPQVPLPPALGVQVARVEAAEASPWSSVPAPSEAVVDALRRLDIDEPPTPCDGFAPRLISEGVSNANVRGRATLTLPLASGRLLIGDALGRGFLLDPTGTFTTVDLGFDGPFLAGYEDFEGELWLLAGDGRLVRGPLGGPYMVQTSSVPFYRPGPGVDFAALVGPTDPSAPFELFAAGDDRTVARFELGSATWQDLTAVERTVPPSETDEILPGLAWLGPNDVFAAGVAAEDRAGLLRFLAGVPEPVEIDLTGRDDLLRFTAAGDGLLMTTGDRLFSWDGQTWMALFDVPRLPIVAVPASTGILVGAWRSVLSVGAHRWHFATEARLCPLGLPDQPAVFFMWPVGPDEWMGITTTGFSPEAAFGTVRVRLLPPDVAPCTGGTIQL